MVCKVELFNAYIKQYFHAEKLFKDEVLKLSQRIRGIIPAVEPSNEEKLLSNIFEKLLFRTSLICPVGPFLVNLDFFHLLFCNIYQKYILIKLSAVRPNKVKCL